MTRATTRRRGRSLAATAVAGGFMLGGLGAATTSAHAADPAGDCTPAYDTSQLQKDDEVTGLTVETGTTPEQFTGTVLGTITDGIAPGLDMIMVDLDSPAIERAGGIWQGMSGSPVYIDGQLIGAVAYGLSWGPSPIAGVTPFSEMQRYLSSHPDAKAPAKVAVGKPAAKTIAAQGDATREQASQGFSQLKMPMGVTGLSQARLDKAAQRSSKLDKPYLTDKTFSAGQVGVERAASSDDIVAGGNLAATIAYGDVTYGGVGTATEVCQGEVVGFGHPFTFTGETTLGLHPADAIYVQPDSLGSPFKVANIAPATGTITQDRLSGITGLFGEAPEHATISSDVTHGTSQRAGSSDVYLPDATADVTFSEHLANTDRVLDGVQGGTSAMQWQVDGTDENGEPFQLLVDDTYVSRGDISIESAFEPADAAYALSTLEGVTVNSVSEVANISDSTDKLKVQRVEQFRGGKWHKVNNRRNPIVAMPGKLLKLRAVLEAPDGTESKVPWSTKVGPRARSGFLSVFGGLNSYTNVYRAKSVSDVIDAYAKAPKNTDVAFNLRLRRNGGRVVEGVPAGDATTPVGGGKFYGVEVGGKGGPVDCRGC
ncbi:SpoIVB peptidase S55 domain-containing protein [Nocardioides acrostichi]|uniref:Peptidase S55 domain-containing protein n=1 Tax=Nocardioides acrostichi TaxID=2784339 RepID=A0A930Y953_9ACTN|nr:SpoIVB peptidase S55 domain-containing protein [Nocardioides acrostichi]MBF4163761.1 hypothetical protein [Nocardioides acrostichi]